MQIDNDDFPELLKLVAAHFKTNASKKYCLHLQRAVTYQPDVLVPVESWSDCFDYACCLPNVDSRGPYRVYQRTHLFKLQTLHLLWVRVLLFDLREL